MKGFAVLTAYKAGTYVPGMERDLVDIDSSKGNLDNLAQSMLADYGRIKHTELSEEKKTTFAEVYEEFYDYKYECDKSRQYSKSSRDSTRCTSMPLLIRSLTKTAPLLFVSMHQQMKNMVLHFLKKNIFRAVSKP